MSREEKNLWPTSMSNRCMENGRHGVYIPMCCSPIKLNTEWDYLLRTILSEFYQYFHLAFTKILISYCHWKSSPSIHSYFFMHIKNILQFFCSHPVFFLSTFTLAMLPPCISHLLWLKLSYPMVKTITPFMYPIIDLFICPIFIMLNVQFPLCWRELLSL